MTKRAISSIAGLGIAALLFCNGSLARSPISELSYLPRAGFSLLNVLPPPPVQGDPRYETDRSIFLKTRSLEGTERWKIATRDVSEQPADLLQDFSCAANLRLTPENAPHLTALLVAAARDTARVNDEAKNFFRRARPFRIDHGPTCQPVDAMNSFDYPSGHTTRGLTWASILAELLPERAEYILARGRAYGESRIVCGVHNASAVEAGRLSASSTLTVLRRNPRFQADMRIALRELERLKRGENAPVCSVGERIIPSIFNQDLSERTAP
jgi:acid phosphatase (class A)